MILMRREKVSNLFFFLRVLMVLDIFYLYMFVVLRFDGIVIFFEWISFMVRIVNISVERMVREIAKCMDAVSSYWRLSSF